MRKGLLGIWLWFLAAGPLWAQSAPAKADTPAAPTPAAEPSGKTDLAQGEPAPQCRVWARPDYLLWWVKNTPLPVPVLTTGDPRVGFDPNAINTVNTAGALGQPGTKVLL